MLCDFCRSWTTDNLKTIEDICHSVRIVVDQAYAARSTTSRIMRVPHGIYRLTLGKRSSRSKLAIFNRKSDLFYNYTTCTNVSILHYTKHFQATLYSIMRTGRA
ncbi:hypothetical protein H109_05566 [Trichophyton interdigitale MR816]|uniref:Uncharacterized protein n=1 Tax=Trichophyton interdigitale (strain MR816) TaxID=1215338 RepID=A0A059J4W8_TRIIM|nr:hypothetical protein H109_05566 [Trichophyton interdigitale MR816]